MGIIRKALKRCRQKNYEKWQKENAKRVYGPTEKSKGWEAFINDVKKTSAEAKNEPKKK